MFHRPSSHSLAARLSARRELAGGRHARWLFAALLAGLVAGCPSRTEVHVDCRPEGDGLKCVVEHRAGSTAAKACWDVAFTCKNGTKSRASACQVVEPGNRAIARMPMSDFPDAKRCDIITDSAVENIQISRPD